MRPPSPAAPQRGSIPVVAALLMPVLIGFIGLASDSGKIYLEKRKMQTAADAGALAAAFEIDRQAGREQIVAAAQQDAGLNGYAGADTRVKLAPDAGLQAGHVEVLVGRQVPTQFMGLFGIPSVAVSARAVAGADPAKPCVLALNAGNVEGALTVAGAGTVAADNCDIFVNGTVPDTLKEIGSMTVSASNIGLQAARYYMESDSHISPAPALNQKAMADPLATLRPPGGGPARGNGTIGGSGTHQLLPGVYNGGIHISGGATVNFAPGIYVLKGPFSVNGSVTLTGDGVSFYTQGPVNISGSGVVQLSAPADGPMAGILFYGDRDSVTGSNDIIGSSAWTLAGALYFPSSKLNLLGSGGFKGDPYLMLIADTLSFTGGMESNFRQPVYNPAFRRDVPRITE